MLASYQDIVRSKSQRTTNNIQQVKAGFKHFVKRTKMTVKSLEGGDFNEICVLRKVNKDGGRRAVSELKRFQRNVELLENLLKFTLYHHKEFSAYRSRVLMVEDLDHAWSLVRSLDFRMKNRRGLMKFVRVPCRSVKVKSSKSLLSVFHNVYKELISSGGMLSGTH